MSSGTVEPMGSPKEIVLAAWQEFAGHERDRIARFIADEFPDVFDTDIVIGFGAVVEEGDTVVVEERMRATLPGGRPYDVEYCFVLELRNGLIHRVREYLDTRRGLEMFGTVPAPA